MIKLATVQPSQPSPAQPSPLHNCDPSSQLYRLKFEAWTLEIQFASCSAAESKERPDTGSPDTASQTETLFANYLEQGRGLCVHNIGVPHPHTLAECGRYLNDNPGLVPAEVWTKAWCITWRGWGWSLVSVSERSKCHCLMDYGRCPRTLPPVATMGQVPAAHNMTTQYLHCSAQLGGKLFSFSIQPIFIVHCMCCLWPNGKHKATNQYVCFLVPSHMYLNGEDISKSV